MQPHQPRQVVVEPYRVGVGIGWPALDRPSVTHPAGEPVFVKDRDRSLRRAGQGFVLDALERDVRYALDHLLVDGVALPVDLDINRLR